MRIHTIGHSRHPLDHFLRLLHHHAIATLVDVRSIPYSQWAPQFQRRRLAPALRAAGVDYVWLGEALGGRPEGKDWYDAQGRLDHARRRETADFQAGVGRLVELARERSVALMCAEENPAHCHRRRLLGPALAGHGVSLVHIRGDGRLQDEPPAPPVPPGLFPP